MARPTTGADRRPAAHRDRGGRHRHRRRGLHRHAGPPPGQAAARPLLPRPRARGRHRGLQLPARRRRRHEHRRRLRDQLVGARLRRHVLRPGPRRRCAAPPAPGTRPPSSATSPGSTAAALVAQSPRSVLSAQVDRAAALGLAAHCGTELEFIVFEDSFDAGVGPRLHGPHPRQPLQRRLLHPRRRPRRAAAARDPQRDVCRRGRRRERQGGVQPRPARDRLPLRRGACARATTTSSTATPPRRSPPGTASR